MNKISHAHKLAHLILYQQKGADLTQIILITISAPHESFVAKY